jgi:hypothetical protein
VPGPGDHEAGDISFKFKTNPSIAIGNAKRELADHMVVTKSNPGVGQYAPLRSDFEKPKAGVSIRAREKPRSNQNPGPACHTIVDTNAIGYTKTSYKPVKFPPSFIKATPTVKVNLETSSSGIPTPRMLKLAAMRKLQKT